MGDQDFWLRLGRGRELLHVPEVTGLAWITDRSLSGEQGAADEIREIQSRHLDAYLATRPGERPLPGRAGTVTAVILADGDAEALRGCLRDLAGQTLASRGALDILVAGGLGEGERAAAEGARAGLVPGGGSPGALRNRAVRAAAGDYLILVEPGDRFRPDALERLAGALDGSGEALVHADALLTATKGETWADNAAGDLWSPPAFGPRQALVEYPFGAPVLWRRVLHRGLGLFDPYLAAACEHEFYLRLVLARGGLRLEEALCLRVGTEAARRSRKADADREAVRFLREGRLTIPLDQIYPGLQADGSREARGAAALDFGALLLDPRCPAAPDVAEFHFRNALDDLGRVPEALYDLSLALFDQGRREEAKPLLAELAARHPEFLRQMARDGAAAGGARLILRRGHPVVDSLPPIRFAADCRVPVPARIRAGRTATHA